MANVVVTIFDVGNDAYKAYTDLKNIPQSKSFQMAQLALVTNDGGNILIKDAIDFNNSSHDYAIIGGIVGGLLGIVGGPLGLILGAGIGALTGDATGSMEDSQSDSLVEEVTHHIMSGETAIVGLVSEDNEEKLNQFFEQYSVQIFRWDAVALAHEVEIAGKVQDDLYDKVHHDMNQRRLEHLKQQGSEIRESIKSLFKHH